MRAREDSVAAASEIDGWMSTTELRWLYDNAVRSPVVIEIGIWLGRSTTVLCDACPGVVIAIDHFGGGTEHEPASPQAARDLDVRTQARANLKPYLDAGKLLLVERDSYEAWRDIAGLFFWRSDHLASPFADLVFIDGDHRSAAVRQDLQYEDFVKPGGIVAGHDIDHDSVKKVIVPRYPDVQVCDRIWWVRKA